LGLVLIGLLKSYFNGPTYKNKTKLNGKIIIVTGASDGIGKITAEDLLKSGATVVYACRNEKKTKEAINELDKKLQENAIYMNLDLSSFESVLSFTNEFKSKFERLDILINNAGGIFGNFSLTNDQVESTYQLNMLSPMILTQELLSILHKSNGKVINLSSKSHIRVPMNKNIIEDWLKSDWSYNKSNDYNFNKQYGYAKLGNVYFNQYLHEYIKQNSLNVSTYSLHPGVIRTEIVKGSSIWYLKLGVYLLYPLYWLITKSIIQGAQTTLFLAYEDKSKLKSGEYYADCALKSTASHASWDKTEIRDLYIEFCRKMINQTNKADFKIKINRL
jgi:retinol dehydrogenase-12